MRPVLFVAVALLILAPWHGWSFEKKNILILHSYHEGLSWTQKSSQGIQNVFFKEGREGVTYNIDYEYMDTKRFVSKKYYKQLKDLYLAKSKKLKYDVIISTDDNAFKFLLQYRNEIWGKVPVVFCGVNFFSDDQIKDKWGYTGVVEEPDVQSTIDIALKLHPDTKQIYIVGDQTTTSDMDRKAVNKVLHRYKKYTFNFMVNAVFKEYRQTLTTLPDHSIVLFMHYNRDSEGNFYSFEESFDVLTPGVMAPIYSFWDFYINRGALVGGMIVSGVAQGEEAARKALKILHGSNVSGVSILRKSPNQYMFDYTVMQRFGLELSQLPEGSIVFNKPKGLADFYREYKTFILGVLALVVFLTSVIIVLSFNILRRKKVEKQLRLTNKAYNRFVPHQFLDHLGRSDIISVQLGDQIESDMTILFSDIRSFTNLSEKMTPQENFNFLNSYLQIMSPVIKSCNGFIDKYIGDAIMAIFPDKTEDAIKAAVQMRRELIEYNINRGKMGYDPIDVGIGIHHGRTMLGTVGSENRMEGTVISDAVNLASRLEGLTKVYGASVLASGAVVDNLDDQSVLYNYRYLGKVRVKGKDQGIDIYEIIDGNTNDIVEIKLKTKSMYEKAVSFYLAAEFDKAQEKFEQVIKLSHDTDKGAAHMIQLIQELKERGVPENWDGTERRLTK